jgi:hypothetical protein
VAFGHRHLDAVGDRRRRHFGFKSGEEDIIGGDQRGKEEHEIDSHPDGSLVVAIPAGQRARPQSHRFEFVGSHRDGLRAPGWDAASIGTPSLPIGDPKPPDVVTVIE